MPRMIAVTSEQWADHCSKWRCYGTEPNEHTMLHKHSVTREEIGLVSYRAPKQYFINPDVKTPVDYHDTGYHDTGSNRR